MSDSVVKDYKIFFTGENHTFRKSNYLLQLKMLKYLHQRVGVRHLFIEFGYSRGWLINQYVQTGDTTLYNAIADYSYDEYTLLYKGIYEYNKKQDAARKIMISGIDVERSIPSAIKVMALMLPQEDPPAAIAVHVDALRALEVMIDERQQSKNDYDIMGLVGNRYSENASLRKIINDYDSNHLVYKNYLGDQYEDFNRIVTGIKAEFMRKDYQAVNAVQQYIFREQFMFERLSELIHQYPDDKFYSQFGRCHTSVESNDYWCGYYFYRTLSSRINQSTDSLLHHKVLSIACYYPEASGKEAGVTGIKKMDELLPYCEKEKLTLFEVDQDTSLFSDFIGKFQFVIVNWNLPGKDRASIDSLDKDGENDDYSYQERLTLAPRYSYLSNSMRDFRNKLATPYDTMTSFSDWSQWIGGEMNFTVNGTGFFALTFDKRVPEKYTVGNTVLSLNGYVTRMRGGPELSWAKWLAFSPYAGLGFGRLKLEEKTSGISGGSSVFTSNSVSSVWKNPFILYEMGLDLKFQFSVFSLGISGGGQLDLTQHKWRQNETIDLSEAYPEDSYENNY